MAEQDDDLEFYDWWHSGWERQQKLDEIEMNGCLWPALEEVCGG
jgi:hypothetical protein